MKVRELKEKLKDLDPELEVYLSIDEEGNRFHKLADCEEDIYLDSRPLQGDDIRMCKEECNHSYCNVKRKTLTKGVTLWP